MKGILVINEFLRTNKFNEIHNWLLEAAKRQNIELQIKTNAEIMIDIAGNSKPQEERVADFVLFWDKDIKLAYYLEQLGYPVFNSSKAIEICDNKALTHLTLMNAGLPMPRTIVAPYTFANIGYTNYIFLDNIAKSLSFPIIIKESFGSFGQQVYLAKNKEELKQKVKKLGTKSMIFQEYIASSYGRDIRLQVVGNKVVAAMYRYSEEGDFRANVTIGGKMKPYQPTMTECDLAIRCCEIIGLDFAGVDILFGEQGEPILCEVNSNAHFKNIYDCTGVNAADYIISHIISKR